MEVSIGGGRRGRAPVVLIRRIAELGAVSDSGGQTPQVHVGGTFVFPSADRLTETAQISQGTCELFSC